jgi:hypothetical protein
MAWRADRLAVVGLAVAVVLAGCSSGKTDQDKAKDAVTTFFAAVADNKPDVACVRLTPTGMEQISRAAFLLRTPGTCLDAIKALNRQLDSSDKKALRSAKVTKVVVNGERATVAQSDIQIKVSGQSSLFRSSTNGSLRLEKVAGDWKIASLG